jgi:hypothetical protein
VIEEVCISPPGTGKRGRAGWLSEHVTWVRLDELTREWWEANVLRPHDPTGGK